MGDQVGGESVYFFISLFTGLENREHSSDWIGLIVGLYGFSLLCLEIQFIVMRIVVPCARVIVCEVKRQERHAVLLGGRQVEK